MNIKFAKELDAILAEGVKTNGVSELSVFDYSITTLGDRLEKDGFGKWQGGNLILVFDAGLDFYKNEGGYTALLKKEEENKKERELQVELTKRQIRQLKRQPYIIAWGVLTTLTSIVLAIL